MTRRGSPSARLARAVHGLRTNAADAAFEAGLSEYLRSSYDASGLADVYARFQLGEGKLELLMRRALVRALARNVGDALHLGEGVGFKHPETFEIGSGVFIGAHTYIQGRFDGRCVIGNHVWIGPHSYFDARDLVLEEYVGWGPGAKVLGSTHTGMPFDRPIIQTDLDVRPVSIRAWADVGTNAVVLPGVTVGKGSIVGAGAVVSEDVAPFSIVAGVPARFLRWRPGYASQAARRAALAD